MTGLIDSMPVSVTARVWPSGALCATLIMAMLPPAPGRFSTTTVCPSSSCRRGLSMRAATSVAPPGG
jgi:hypothetical protein